MLGAKTEAHFFYDSLNVMGAMRELERLRSEVVRELMSAPTSERFRSLALYVEAIDISIDALVVGMRVTP